MASDTLHNYKKLYFWLAVWFGCGLSPKAPGTVGSIGALPFAIAVFAAFGIQIYLVYLMAVLMLGYWATAEFERASSTHDSKMIVIDEVIGQWIALIPVFAFFGLNLPMIGLSFILFRFFDVIKPWPVSHYDKNVKGAPGVIGDDIVAGALAAWVIIGLKYAGLG